MHHIQNNVSCGHLPQNIYIENTHNINVTSLFIGQDFFWYYLSFDQKRAHWPVSWRQLYTEELTMNDINKSGPVFCLRLGLTKMPKGLPIQPIRSDKFPCIICCWFSIKIISMHSFHWFYVRKSGSVISIFDSAGIWCIYPEPALYAMMSHSRDRASVQGPLLLTWFNINSNMDNQSYTL